MMIHVVIGLFLYWKQFDQVISKWRVSDKSLSQCRTFFAIIRLKAIHKSLRLPECVQCLCCAKNDQLGVRIQCQTYHFGKYAENVLQYLVSFGQQAKLCNKVPSAELHLSHCDEASGKMRWSLF